MRRWLGFGFVAVGIVVLCLEEEALRISMGYEPDGFDLTRARYHKVCIVASEDSPVRAWVSSFFAEHMPELVAAGGLHVCTPPFDRDRVAVLTPG